MKPPLTSPLEQSTPPGAGQPVAGPPDSGGPVSTASVSTGSGVDGPDIPGPVAAGPMKTAPINAKPIAASSAAMTPVAARRFDAWRKLYPLQKRAVVCWVIGIALYAAALIILPGPRGASDMTRRHFGLAAFVMLLVPSILFFIAIHLDRRHQRRKIAGACLYCGCPPPSDANGRCPHCGKPTASDGGTS